jgi:oligoendopeptidase F
MPENAAEALPAWDLRDLYPAPDSAELEADLDRAAQQARAFEAAQSGRLAALSGRALAVAIGEYERIEEILGRVMSYAQLQFAGNSNDPQIGRFYQSMNERVTAISANLLFFTLELNRLDDAVMEAKLADPDLARYRPWKSCCTRKRSPVPPPGRACSTRPSPGCA